MARHLRQIVAEQNIHLTIANGENAAGGFGITPPLADELFAHGVDVLTSGNHIWDKREIYDYLPQHSRLLRPADSVEDLPGCGVVVVEARNGAPCAVINLQGRVYMPTIEMPFSKSQRAAGGAAGGGEGALRGFSRRAHQRENGHGMAPGRARVRDGGHAYPHPHRGHAHPSRRHGVSNRRRHDRPVHSVIGVEKELILERFLTQLPVRMEAGRRGPELHGVIVEVDDATGRAAAIRRVEVFD